jgi:DNA-binding HxlR family transcriptional regulator
MPTTRSYGDACPIARALDVVGERWAMLVVRELLLGAQRFSDLRRALPGASTNMLTDRLRELTERGRDLEPVLDALGAWGSLQPRPDRSSLTATSVLLFLRGSARAHPDPPNQTYRVQLDDRIWTLSSRDGQFEIDPGDPHAPVASLHTDPDTLNELLHHPADLDTAIAEGSVRTEGDLSAVRHLLRVAA